MEQEKTKIIDGKLHIYCKDDDTYYPKYLTTESGIQMELDEKHFIYVLEGDTLDESLDSNYTTDIGDEDYPF